MKITQESLVWFITLILSISTFTINEVGLFPDWAYPWLKYVSGILGILAAALGASPLPRQLWTQQERTVERGKATIKRLSGMIVLLAVLPFVQACHGPINIQTNPVGGVAHYGKQVIDIVQAVQDAVVAAELAKIPGVTVERIAPVVRATIFVGSEAQKLADALVELDALPIGDLSRATKIKAIGVILATTNALIFNMVVPVGDDPLLIKIRDLVREVSVLLLRLQDRLQANPAASLLDTSEWRVPVPARVLYPSAA